MYLRTEKSGLARRLGHSFGALTDLLSLSYLLQTRNIDFAYQNLNMAFYLSISLRASILLLQLVGWLAGP